ncbi:hypothetical protein QUV83_10150 [Cellulomonas cellasea]|uniref:AbiTii domain-containing protein n=1 Tax=Cellulomonas cellasea TaxID=43670 RepID=UPI0025A3809C|nr:hypothetical protein [Cellulomonas cellasea]MDM8085126.1 hypothetical protein [Cellulomonas cellasea]
MSRLATLIDQAADGSRSLSDVIRQVKILAARIGDDTLARWATNELNGYGQDQDLPEYRARRHLPARGTWSGPGGLSVPGQVSPAGIAEDFLTIFSTEFREPVAELERLSTGDRDPMIKWDPYQVNEYDRRTRNGEGGARIELLVLSEAWLVVPRTMLAGILDKIRTRVLDLALALEDVAPDAGEPGGPTVADHQLGSVVQTFNITVNGDGANIATGEGARQRSTVKKGDLADLVRAARELGLSAEHATEFGAAVQADGGVVGARTRTFVERVRVGAIALAGDVAANVAASGLLELVAGFSG